jgi:hypothetical protein
MCYGLFHKCLAVNSGRHGWTCLHMNYVVPSQSSFGVSSKIKIHTINKLLLKKCFSLSELSII